MKEMMSLEDWDACLSASDDKPVLVFKHSTRCPISTAAHTCVTKYEQDAPEVAPEVRMVKVIESRPVSNAIAEALDVAHQSPQLILLRGRKALWSASHYDISAENIARALDILASR